jgi:hypothetical protein
MKTDEITELLHEKLGGLTFDADICTPDGQILGVRPGKKKIARFIAHGGLPALLGLLVVDPARLRSYGTQGIRKELDRLAHSTQSGGKELAEALSRLLRAKRKAEPNQIITAQRASRVAD